MHRRVLGGHSHQDNPLCFAKLKRINMHCVKAVYSIKWAANVPQTAENKVYTFFGNAEHWNAQKGIRDNWHIIVH